MTLLRKDTPGSAPGEYEWAGPDDVVDVPRALAADLLSLPDGDFHEVTDPSAPAEPPTPPAAPVTAPTTPPTVVTNNDGSTEQGQPVEPVAVEQQLADLPKNKADLQALAAEYGLNRAGTIAELTDRITAHLEALKTPIAENPVDGGPQATTPTT